MYVFEQLDEWTEMMRQDIEIKDYPNGWFGQHQRCAKGQDIFGWILKHVEQDQKKGFNICQKMLEQSLFQAVDNVNGSIFGINNNLYRFYFDIDEIADNMVKKWNGETNPPLQVSQNLVELITDLYQ